MISKAQVAIPKTAGPSQPSLAAYIEKAIRDHRYAVPRPKGMPARHRLWGISFLIFLSNNDVNAPPDQAPILLETLSLVALDALFCFYLLCFRPSFVEAIFENLSYLL